MSYLPIDLVLSKMNLCRRVDRLEKEMKRMTENQAALDAQIATLTATVQALAGGITQLTTDFAVLQTAIAASAAGPDLTNEVNAVASAIASLQQATSQVGSLDQQVQADNAPAAPADPAQS